MRSRWLSGRLKQNFSHTKNDIFGKSNNSQLIRDYGDFMLLDEISKRTFFSHRELARCLRITLLEMKRDDLAKRINPAVGTEAGTNSEGQISNLTHLIQSSAATYSKIKISKRKSFL